MDATNRLREKLRERDEKLETARGRNEALREQNDRLRGRLEEVRRRAENKDREILALHAQLARVQNSESSLEPNRRPPDAPPVFFLVGQAKSGTSWLMRTLDAHPEVLCKGEGRFFGLGYKREDIKRMDSRTIQPSSLYRAILDDEYLNAWIERSVWTRDDDEREHLDGLMRAAVDYFLTAKLRKSGKRIVGDKTPFLGDGLLGEIHEVYPGAKVIHIIRDGRDAAVSTMHHLWNRSVDLGGHRDLTPEETEKRDRYREDPTGFVAGGESIFTEGRIRDLAEAWSARVGQAVQQGPALLGESYVEVRYEDLLRSTGEEVARLLLFLGADWSPEAVDYCVHAASFESWSKGRERGREESTAFLRKGVAGDWENVFTDRDRRIFEEVAGEALIDLGYERDDDW